MKLIFDKTSFVDCLLGPVSKIADNLSLDFSEPSMAKTLVGSADGTLILQSKIPCASVDVTGQIIIPDCKTFLRLFAGIDNQQITLHINSNTVVYKDNQLSFKYHLLDESYIVNKKAFNEEKLSQIKYDTNFVLTKQKLSEIIKFNSIIPDAEKLYFFSEDSKMFAKIGDEQKPNTNEVVTEISNNFDGTKVADKIPVDIRSILMFSFGSDDVRVEVNHSLKLFKFSSNGLNYIVSGLVK